MKEEHVMCELLLLFNAAGKPTSHVACEAGLHRVHKGQLQKVGMSGILEVWASNSSSFEPPR